MDLASSEAVSHQYMAFQKPSHSLAFVCWTWDAISKSCAVFRGDHTGSTSATARGGGAIPRVGSEIPDVGLVP